MAALYFSHHFTGPPVSGAASSLDTVPPLPDHSQTSGFDRPDGGVDDTNSPDVRENRLGDWWATRLPLRPARFVLAVSEHARLAVVVNALPEHTLLERIPDALYALLLAIKVPPDLARRERAAMQPLRPMPTSAKHNGVLGVLKAYAIELQAAWETGVSRSADELSLYLAGRSTELLDGATPAQVARRRFHLLPDKTEALGL